MDSERLAARHVVLLGMGHTNAHVLRMWRMNPVADADLTCISDNAIATYSGMLPAALANQIQPEEMEIDLVRLCSSVSARLIVEKPCGLDHQQRRVLFRDRPPIPYDLLSIGIGSVPTTDDVEVEGSSLLKIKPMQTFRARLAAKLSDLLTHASPAKEIQIAVVGSGVAGIEILFCVSPFLRKLGANNHRLHLVSRSEQILPDGSRGTQKRVVNEIAKRGVTVTAGHAVVGVTEDGLQLDNGQVIPADLVIWATGASAPADLQHFDLPTDARGFIATDHTLRSTSGEPVFAVGDTGTITSERLPKAGVYAVRQGPVLWDNIQRFFRGQAMRAYKPQRSFLKLINLGDGRAIGEWKGISYTGSAAYWLKNKIDSKFMEKFRPDPMTGDDDEPMQCRGCGCKLASRTLDAALGLSDASLHAAGSSATHVRLEDAAEIGGEADPKLLASTDFFSNPFDDAYLAGRVAAIHAASDILATGACVTEALANVVVPEGPANAQQLVLSDFLNGARREFSALDARVVGGHTIVGPRMEIGFTVIGRPVGEMLLRKDGLQPGDLLYLTKPLGVGVLLAAHMRSECRAADFDGLIRSMLQSQVIHARIAVELGLTACTDVTGFGLAGHLLEMLETSHVSATIRLNDIPILSGATMTVQDGIESSLIDDNLSAESKMDVKPALRSTPRYRLLFDPQTCGGFLFGVPPAQEEKFLDLLQASHASLPARIGEVTDVRSGTIRVLGDQSADCQGLSVQNGR